MSLVECPECGRQKVSDSAVSCPDCGFAVKEYYDKLRIESERIKEEQAAIEKENERERIKAETKKDRQAETIKRLESSIEDYKSEIPKYSIVLIISIIVTCVCWHYSTNGDLGLFIVIGGFASFGSGVFLYSAIQGIGSAEEDLSTARSNMKEYERKLEERRKANEAQAKINAAQNEIKHPKCPMCCSRNTERISTLDRTVSIAAAGLASSKIGKQYQCKKCKHKW